jgi:hypothetical protein
LEAGAKMIRRFLKQFTVASVVVCVLSFALGEEIGPLILAIGMTGIFIGVIGLIISAITAKSPPGGELPSNRSVARIPTRQNNAKASAKKELTPSERDKIWRNYSDQCRKHLNDKNYGFYRNTRYDMAMFLKKENKYITAIALLAEVIFWDLTGCGNSFDYSLFLQMCMGIGSGELIPYKHSIFPYDKSIMKLAPGIIREIGICQRKVEVSDEHLSEYMMDSLRRLTAPVQFFTYAEILDIFFLERNKRFGNSDTETERKTIAELKMIYATAQKRFDPQYPNRASQL